MSAKRRVVCKKPASGFQLDEFTRGRIVGQFEAGAKPKTIAAQVSKTDRSKPKLSCVYKTINKFKLIKNWRGKRKEGSGRPGLLTDDQKDDILDLVIEERGKAVVTARFIRQRMPALRKVSRQTIYRALHEAGLAYLRRRKKT